MTDSSKTPIDFWFDFSSPYGYLMAEKIDDLAAKYGRKVKWHPILLGVIFQTLGTRPPLDGTSSKSTYMWRDFARSARFMGIPYRHPTHFPLADDRDISSPETVLDIGAGLGVDHEALAAALQNPDIKARLKDEVDAAIKAGVFGSPHVIIDGEAFFGADRLPQMERWLETGGF